MTYRVLRACLVTAALLGIAGKTRLCPAAARAAARPLVYFIFTRFAYPYFAPMADGVKAAARE